MIGEISNHLWQSTLFAVAAGLLTLALRKNQARIRYWLWFSASVKFLVPFTLLITFGSQLQWASARQIAPPAVSSAMAQISQPFTDFSVVAEPTAPSTAGDAGPFLVAILALWMSGAIALALSRFRLRRRVRAVVRASTPRDLARIPPGVAVRSAPGLMEPGVVGWWRPVLLVPQDIEQHLTARQLDAIVAHELCHVRRRDNLTSTIHMVVETVFWFHPLVWWIGARLIEERERACDEEVLQLCGDPRIYADGILNVCRRYAEAPLVCMSGVSGANLRTRIEAIMMNRVGRRLNAAAKVALAGTGATAIGAPIVLGILLSAPTLRAQFEPITAATPRFEVASVRRNVSASQTSAPGPLSRTGPLPGGGYIAGGLRLIDLIRSAYRLQAAQVVGAPSWVNDERYDIEARAPGATPAQNNVMLRALLFDRFGMRAHVETRELPVYALMPVKPGVLGPGLKTTGECAKGPPVDAPDQPMPCGVLQFGAGQLNAAGASMGQLASIAMNMAQYTGVDRIVLDRSGLTGNYFFQLRFRPVGRGGGPSVAPNPDAQQRPDFFTALREEFGLKLEPQTAPIEVLVIDRIDRPTPD